MSIGCAALGSLREPVTGRVEAVFGSTFYVGSEGRLICLGHAGLESGPINCTTSAPTAVDWRASGIKRHDWARLSSKTIEINGTYQFTLSGSHTWRPEPGPRSVTPDKVERGVNAFRRAMVGRHDIDGLGRFLIPAYRPAARQFVCQAAESPMARSRQWLVNAFRAPSNERQIDGDWVKELSGLGPGLTPSGDDYLGGMMIALHGLGAGHLSHALWPAIRHHAQENRNAISLAHLRAAAEGMGSAAIHRAMAAVMGAELEALDQVMDRVARIGHSSGWDTMTAVIATLDAWLAARPRQASSLAVRTTRKPPTMTTATPMPVARPGKSPKTK